ncbi:MAG: dTDP-glucose 4,6-dehydratase [Gammaproteobacteria bacterium]|nr:dTDP-glucose 4,6-dehydratase [Gammaproteobacteria bacterium]|tara:strand:- start:689 stop:1747 length:1059 start_codon:yes stop_codon:yes gene_type:complete
MKIFITGGSGFIGGNFILKYILGEDNIILNYDKLTYAANKLTLKNIEHKANYYFQKGDICNRSLLRKKIKNFNPDVIINFAAESHVDRSIDSPLEFIETNILGTSILLQESFYYYKSLTDIKKKHFRFIHISTDEVYGSLGDKGYFVESTSYNPSSPYSASKASSDHLVRAWYYTYGLPVIITNCSNNYGPFQFPEKLIPLMVLNCIKEKKLPIYGQGKNIRDWLYVEDHCDAIMSVIKKGVIGETYNIGGDNEISNIEIVKTICRKMDKIIPRKNNKKYKDLIEFVPDRPGHDYRYAIDASKIKKIINWTPKESFDTGIMKTILWYLDNKNWWEHIQRNVYQQQRLGIIEE